MFFLLRICMMALNALRANLLRSLLATLGVIIGVAAVISAMSILEGASREVMNTIQSFGADQVIVWPARTSAGGRAVRNTETLTIEDADALHSSGSEYIIHAAPEVQIPSVVVKHGNRNKSYWLLGTNETYPAINRYKVMRGEFLNPSHVLGDDKVCVLGYEVARDLFGQADPLGFMVKIHGMGFRVIGVMEKKGNLAFRNVDNQVIIPVTTGMKRLLGTKTVSDIVVQSRDADSLAKATDDVKKTLRKRHRLSPGQANDFDLFTQEETKKQFTQTIRLFAVVLYSIAGISLVVGGIGIMNIMLVSVTERTREIGVRIAVGAQRWDILRQFIIESSTISLLGGLCGVLLGVGFNNMIEKVTQVLTTYTPPRVVAIAVGMAFLTGLFSGIYPAYKASRLDPVEALRYE
jgi:putative ABC transport system permease protein